LADIADTLLAKHISECQSVARSDDSLAIGTPDGKVHLFRKRKHLQFAVFQAPVDIVAIDSTGRYVAALSYGSGQVRKIEVPTNGFSTEKITVVGEIKHDRDVRYEIAWGPDGNVVVGRVLSE
jgi:6-phosphogluconolactonase (cycloisomerase 2 family)